MNINPPQLVLPTFYKNHPIIAWLVTIATALSVISGINSLSTSITGKKLLDIFRFGNNLSASDPTSFNTYQITEAALSENTTNNIADGNDLTLSSTATNRQNEQTKQMGNSISENSFVPTTTMLEVDIDSSPVSDFQYEIGKKEVIITKYWGKDSVVRIPSIIEGLPVTVIAYESFSNNKNIESVVIPNSVLTIGYFAFGECTSLNAITIPNSITKIGSYTFNGCMSLTSVILPTGLKTIETGLFQYCSGLTSIKIPNCVTIIEAVAFAGCSSLKSVDIPNSVTVMGTQTFSDCSNLTSIKLSNNITLIDRWGFYNCVKLESINIPSSVSQIADGAFYQCAKLRSVKFEGEAPTIQDPHSDDLCLPDTFENVSFDFKIYYHSNATGWTSPSWNGYPAAMW